MLHQGHTIWDLSRITDRVRTRIEFPDLIHYRDHWYCAFREGEIHNNHPSGRARLIRSADGVAWETVKLFTWDCGDVREPKFSITAEGRLMINSSVYFVSRQPRKRTAGPGSEASYTPPEARQAHDRADSYYQLDWLGTTLNLPDRDDEKLVTQQSVTWLSEDGLQWSGAYACPSGINGWLWCTTWHAGMGYSVAQWGKDTAGTLYRTRDGRQWRALAQGIFPPDHGGEASLAFDDAGHAIALLRGSNRNKVLVGRSQGPYYQQWTWQEPRIDWHGDGRLEPASAVLGVGLGGPKLLRLPDGRLIAAGRALGPARDDGRATLFQLDSQACTLTRLAECDGTSYPGVVTFGGELWVTYIGSACHQDRWEVKLARIPLPRA